MNRAGHPRWTVAATAVLFVLTTGVAALISHQKSRQGEVVLGRPEAYRALNLRASFPTGWEVGSPQALSGGQLIIASSPATRAGRHLFVFRLHPSLLGPKSLARAAVWPIQNLDPRAEFRTPELEGASHMGSLESQLFHWLVRSPLLGSGTQSCLTNLAVTPDRQILGVLLVVDGRITSRDRRLIQEFSQNVSYQPGRSAPAERGPERLDDHADEYEDAQDTVIAPKVDFL